jgi:hypothetical protein
LIAERRSAFAAWIELLVSGHAVEQVAKTRCVRCRERVIPSAPGSPRVQGLPSSRQARQYSGPPPGWKGSWQRPLLTLRGAGEFAGWRVYLLSSQVGSLDNLPKSGLTITLVVEFPGLMDLSIASGAHPLGAHAALCGAVFVEALITAVRQVSRAALVAAFDDTNLLRYELYYERHSLSGTAEIRFVDLTAP